MEHPWRRDGFESSVTPSSRMGRAAERRRHRAAILLWDNFGQFKAPVPNWNGNRVAFLSVRLPER